MKLFSEDHLWVEVQNGVATVGLSPYAVDELGEITFVELPEIGSVFSQGDVMSVVESAKAATEVLCPMSGTVVQVNQRLDEEPGLLNTAPESAGWLCRLGELDEGELDSLLTEDEYERFVSGGEDETPSDTA